MELICILVRLYVVALFVRIVLSWFPIHPGTAMDSVYRTLRSITDPVLEPVRRVLPPVGGMIDLSPLVVTLAIQIIVVPLVCRG